MEAYDKTNSLYERIKFLSIYDSNLEEFLRNKLGALKRSAEIQNYADGYSRDGVKKILSKIQRIVVKGIEESLRILNEDIIAELKSENIFILNQNDARKDEYKNELDSYFRSHILTYLKPKVILNNYEDDNYTFENIPYLFLRLHKGDADYFGIVNIPANKLQRFYTLKCPNRYCYLFIDDIIRKNLDFVFKDYEIMEAISFKFVQDESLNIEDEFSGNLVEKVKNQLNTKKDTPTNITYQSNASEGAIKFLKKYFKVKSKDMVPGGVYQSLKDLVQLPNPVAPELDWVPIKKVPYPVFERNECMCVKKYHRIKLPYIFSDDTSDSDMNTFCGQIENIAIGNCYLPLSLCRQSKMMIFVHQGSHEPCTNQPSITLIQGVDSLLIFHCEILVIPWPLYF